MQNSSKQAPFFPAKEEQNNKRQRVRRMFISLTLPRGSLNSTHFPSQLQVHLNSVIWEKEREKEGKIKSLSHFFFFLACKIQNKGCGGAGGEGELRRGSFFSPCVLNAARDKWKEWKEKSKHRRISRMPVTRRWILMRRPATPVGFSPVAPFLRCNMANRPAEGEGSSSYICISFVANIKKDQFYESSRRKCCLNIQLYSQLFFSGIYFGFSHKITKTSVLSVKKNFYHSMFFFPTACKTNPLP